MREIKGLSMNPIQAHKILNEVKEGIWHSQNDIVRALIATGDIHGKLSSPDSFADSRRTDSDSPTVHHAAVQSLE
jgi:hypothetical protein